MNVIKKVNLQAKKINNIPSPQTQTNQIETFNANSIRTEEYNKMDNIVDFSSKDRPQNIEEMKTWIENLKNSNMDINKKIALVAAMISVPYIQLHDGTDRGWASAFEQQHGPYMEQYNILHTIVENMTKSDGTKVGEYAYGACTCAAATAIRAVYDVDFPSDSTENQLTYLNNHQDKWDKIKTVNPGEKWGDIKAGDVLISDKVNGRQHIMICIGNKDGVPLIYEGAAVENDFAMYPIVSTSEANQESSIERNYTVFRPKN